MRFLLLCTIFLFFLLNYFLFLWILLFESSPRFVASVSFTLFVKYCSLFANSHNACFQYALNLSHNFACSFVNKAEKSKFHFTFFCTLFRLYAPAPPEHALWNAPIKRLSFIYSTPFASHANVWFFRTKFNVCLYTFVSFCCVYDFIFSFFIFILIFFVVAAC